MASTNGRESSKITASVDSLKLSSKNTSKHASSESVLSRKEKESMQMQECKKKLLANEPQIIIRDDNVLLRSPPQKKIVMPPNINAEELAVATPTQRNWRGILIALLVIALVLGLIVFSIALLTPKGVGGGKRGRRPTLSDLMALKYEPFNGTWLTDEELVYRDRWGGLTLFNVRNYTTRLLMTNTTFRELNAVDFKVSADLKFVLLISDVRAGWKFARLARYHVYDVINRNKIPISPVEDDRSAPLLQYAEWAPSGSGLVFVYDNDIYYKPRVLKALVCRITNTGVPGVVFNGVPDYLYETEVLKLERALWFSSDGQALMYVSYNDSLVPEYNYPWYGLDQPDPPPYPTIRSLRYPKMGTNNPVVTLYVVSLKTPKFLFPHAIQFSSQVDFTWYLKWSSWSSDRQIAVLLLNRPQNVSIISLCSAVHYNCQDIYRDETDGRRWSGLGAEPLEPDCAWCAGSALLASRSYVYTTAPVLESGSTWRHVVRVSSRGGQGAGGAGGVGVAGRDALTQGAWDVTQLLALDQRRNYLYVLGSSSDRTGALARHLYRVQLAESPHDYSPPVCLTCPSSEAQQDATEDDSTTAEYENATSSLPMWPSSTVLPHLEDENGSLPGDCLYNRILFSRNYSYYVQECLGPGVPAFFVRAAVGGAGLAGAGGRRAVLWDGSPLLQLFSSLAQPQQKVFRVALQEGREATVRLLLPAGFRDADDLPLPLVLHLGSEPGVASVTLRWRADWAWYLAAGRNFIVAEIDARGAPGQGEEVKTDIYQKLFSADVEDQLAVLSWLVSRLRMVDGARVGVLGARYGAGAALALAQQDANNATACLCAVSPLTDLTLHNSYWGERHWGFGPERTGAARAAAPWRRAGNLPPRRLLLAHAAADLRSHAQHALALAHALLLRGAPFAHQLYPDEGEAFERSRAHLHRSLERFFDDCFGPVEVADWDSGMGGLFPFRD